MYVSVSSQMLILQKLQWIKLGDANSQNFEIRADPSVSLLPSECGSARRKEIYIFAEPLQGKSIISSYRAEWHSVFIIKALTWPGLPTPFASHVRTAEARWQMRSPKTCNISPTESELARSLSVGAIIVHCGEEVERVQICQKKLKDRLRDHAL